MSIFSKALKPNKKVNSQSHSRIDVRPRLNILATRPLAPSAPEWIIELHIPSSTHPATQPNKRQPATYSATNIFQRHKDAPANTTQPTAPVQDQEASTTPSISYYFSRLHPDSHTEERPENVAVQIFLTSLPISESSPQSTVDTLIVMNKVLASVYLTPDASLWLRQALYALQSAELIPPVSHGLDVNKFMNFATAYLEQNVQTEVSEVKEVNYSKVLRENERLKQMFNPTGTGYTVVNAPNGQMDELRDDEDMWNLPVRSKATKAEKSWGGFWVSHGSGGVSSRSSSQDRNVSELPKRRDVYGGLM